MHRPGQHQVWTASSMLSMDSRHGKSTAFHMMNVSGSMKLFIGSSQVTPRNNQVERNSRACQGCLKQRQVSTYLASFWLHVKIGPFTSCYHLYTCYILSLVVGEVCNTLPSSACCCSDHKSGTASIKRSVISLPSQLTSTSGLSQSQGVWGPPAVSLLFSHPDITNDYRKTCP